MAETKLVDGIAEWLVDQALGQPDIVDMFNGMCHRLHGVGIPIARARLTWPTLHPLFQAETILWQTDEEILFEQFLHQEMASDDWLKSPMKYMLDRDIQVFRRSLEGENKLVDFPVLEELVERGLTDYLMIATNFAGPSKSSAAPRKGILAAWSSDRKGGFSASDVAALQRIQRRFAIACKTVIQARITDNITSTYLGREPGQRVLDGEIRRGDGRETQAVVWYSDLRNSTALADTMPSDDYIQLLNDYFECTAGPVIEAGGDVLDFIGDAVLAVFPISEDADLLSAVHAATTALHQSIEVAQAVNAKRKQAVQLPIKYGIGLNIGSVMFGNIGVPQRLTFSVIGPTVNEVARIESLTKSIDAAALVTKEFAEQEADSWVSVGTHRLDGVAQEIELFALKDADAPLTVKPDAAQDVESAASPRPH